MFLPGPASLHGGNCPAVAECRPQWSNRGGDYPSRLGARRTTLGGEGPRGQDRGFAPMRVAINLSARQLTRYDLVRAVEQALSDAKLPAECLELELTESMVMADPESVIGILAQLKALGIEDTLFDD